MLDLKSVGAGCGSGHLLIVAARSLLAQNPGRPNIEKLKSSILGVDRILLLSMRYATDYAIYRWNTVVQSELHPH
jgi:hypothetical protein